MLSHVLGTDMQSNTFQQLCTTHFNTYPYTSVCQPTQLGFNMRSCIPRLPNLCFILPIQIPRHITDLPTNLYNYFPRLYENVMITHLLLSQRIIQPIKTEVNISSHYQFHFLQYPHRRPANVADPQTQQFHLTNLNPSIQCNIGLERI